jgi:hypothetical protein
MPANIAHMLIAHKALKLLKTNSGQELAEFAEMLDDTARNKNFQAYMNLGSIGPDLYYYLSVAKSVKDMMTEGFVQAKGVTPWSYHLHSCKPNVFPLKLSKILFKDVVRENGNTKLDNDDVRKLAYIAGHLSHIAADQIIHPVVNRIAGPYYRNGDNRKTHRQSEVFQDYFLYEEVYRAEREKRKGREKKKYDFFKQKFNRWVDCIRGITTRNTEDWFRYFLQRGFAETYSTFMSEEVIEDSVDNLLLTLKVCQKIGPYKDAAEEYEKQGAKSPMYREYIKDAEYVRFYEEAIRLSAIYITALYEVYDRLNQGKDFSGRHERRFLSIVNDADLSCPLEQNILGKAYKALIRRNNIKSICKGLFD